MALAPLAAAADLQDRGVTVTNPNLLDKALGVASSAVRDAAGAVIGQVTSTVTAAALQDSFLRLPGPVTAVSSVTIGGTATTDYEIEPDGLYLASGWGGGEIVVTFTHGLAEVPDDIVDLTCQLAISWLNHTSAAPIGSTAGLKSTRLDDAAETYTDEAAGQVSPVFVPRVTREWLAARFGGGAQVVSTR